jgi:hypothetical protein
MPHEYNVASCHLMGIALQVNIARISWRMPMRWRRALVVPASFALLTVLAVPASAGAGPVGASVSSESLATTPVQETATGTARTLDFPGGSYVVARSSGAVSMVDGDGRTAWRLETQDLYQDWDLTWQQPGFTQTPQLDWGTNPVDPLEFSGAAPGLVDDVNPVAVGDLGGSDDVAVAETVGAYITAGTAQSICPWCTWQFDVPGSNLHIGTFVSVLDGRSGKMVYHELVPGFVTQLAIAGGRLIVGQEDGDPQTSTPGFGSWGGVSTVSALTISPRGVARQDWQYSTETPWARLLDIAVTGGQHPGVALGWSDTPLGLGVPGPPDGHLLLLDAATGATRWQIRTTGYPVLAAADDQRNELAVVQLTDPTQSLGYTLGGIRYSDGTVTLRAPRAGSLPLSLAIGHGAQDGWAVGSDDATVQSGTYTPTAGRVTLTDPATGARLWSVILPDSTGTRPPVPAGLAVTGGSVVAVSALGGVIPSAATPLLSPDGMTSLDYRTGKAAWSRFGDPGDPASLSVVAGNPGRVRTVNSHQVVETYDASGAATASTAAGPGDYTSATTASVAAAGSTDLIAGDEDGDVTALDGHALAAGTDQVLWQTHLPGPVQQITQARLDGRDVLVAAATSAVGVLDAHTGRLLRLIGTPGAYVYTATVISAGGTPAVVVPGNSLTAYALTTGARLWSHPAPPGAWFSDAAYADGVVAAEYSNTATFDHGATEMAAVGLDAATGRLSWSQAADPSEVQTGDLWNGTYASPDIAGAGGEGVAFAWAETGGAGKVDVRNITTGALLYSDSSPNLNQLSQLLATPSLGLVGISTQGGARLTPSGAVSTGSLFGVSAALATDAAGDTAMVTGDVSAQAYGTDIFTDPSATVAGSDMTYNNGQLVAGDFAGDGTRQVVAIPADWLAYEVVEAEAGFLYPPDPLAVQHGLALLRLTSQVGTSAHTSPSPLAQKPASSQGRYPVKATMLAAGATKDSAVPAYLRPVGQPGAPVPSPEPRRSGIAQPGTSTNTVRHTVSAAGTTDAAPPGYSPAQMTAHLGLTGDGAGQTIAIVDAYDDPDIVSDAQIFSEQYGLPGVCGDGGRAGDCFTLDVREQNPSAGSDGSWAVETSLDVEWAHSLAPRATIELVETSDSSFASLFRGVATAAAGHPAAISMSWGIPGEFSDEAYYDHFCQFAGSVCVVAAGDYGHPGSYPAYNPSVISVGGTTQNLAADGSVTDEEAWSGSGGGQSWVEREPAYQDTVQSSGSRQIPDVAFDADLGTGVAVYDSVPNQGQQGWWEVGGTSLGAPSWSAIVADTDQLRAAAGKQPLAAAGFDAQKDIYAMPSSVIAPITTGPMNGYCPIGCTPGPGYDEITGLGSPRVGIDAALANG